MHYTQERLDGPSGFYASPVGVDGKVYLAGRSSTTVVLEDSDTLKVLAVNRLDDPIDASPPSQAMRSTFGGINTCIASLSNGL